MKNIIIILLSVLAMPFYAGVIERTHRCNLPFLGKTVYLFGEKHSDPFDFEALDQRHELSQIFDGVCKEHTGLLSCYLECSPIAQEKIRRVSYDYVCDICHHGSFFEQWYFPIAYAKGNDVIQGRLYLSNFDIRDDQCAHFYTAMEMYRDGVIKYKDLDLQAMRQWACTVDATINTLCLEVNKTYPKKMTAFIKRDMQRKKERFNTLFTQQEKKKSSHGSFKKFLDYTDLLVDFTILNKIAVDPHEAIIVHAGGAHTDNLSRYFKQL